MNIVEKTLESLIFQSRWLLAPFFIGLSVDIIALLVKFSKELLTLFLGLFIGGEQDTIISILTLVDMALIASLLLIIMLSGN